jgi:hypothetical protein
VLEFAGFPGSREDDLPHSLLQLVEIPGLYQLFYLAAGVLILGHIMNMVEGETYRKVVLGLISAIHEPTVAD